MGRGLHVSSYGPISALVASAQCRLIRIGGRWSGVALLFPSAAIGLHTWINAGKMTLTDAVVSMLLAACAAMAGSREYQRRLRHLRSRGI